MPRTWSDLAHPRWKDRLVISDPEKTSSSLATLWGINETIGPEPLKGIAKNATITSTASQVYDGVAKGEFAVGMTMEYAAQEYVAGGNKDIEIVAINDLTDTKTLAHLLKWDSTFGEFPHDVKAGEGKLVVGG